MRIGLRKSPHLDAVVAGILASGDTFTSTNDTGADFYLCWGWPQAQDVVKESHGRSQHVICVDAHPFALRAGDRSGDRILQLGNWGALALYPPGRPDQSTEAHLSGGRDRSTPGGPVLVLGHVSSTEQLRQGLVDVWHTPGGDAWLKEECAKPNRKFRPHPRMWPKDSTVRQATLAEDLQGCSMAVGWNSTAVIHARLLGYPADSIEAHGWGRLSITELAGTRVGQHELRSGEYWATVYKPWLASLKQPKE